jgi:hypothetical protein
MSTTPAVLSAAQSAEARLVAQLGQVADQLDGVGLDLGLATQRVQTAATAVVQRLGASMAQAQAALAGVGAVAQMLDAFAAGVEADLLALATQEQPQQLLGVAAAHRPLTLLDPDAAIVATAPPEEPIPAIALTAAETAPLTLPAAPVPMPAAAQVTAPEPAPQPEAPARHMRLSTAQRTCLESIARNGLGGPRVTIEALIGRGLIRLLPLEGPDAPDRHALTPAGRAALA